MSQATLSDRPYKNSNLFSGHYLDERLKERDEWDCDENAVRVFEELRDLYDLESRLVEGYGEDALIDNWIEEVLEVLGFGTQVEVTLPDSDGYVDVLLFEDEEERRSAAEVVLDTGDTTDVFERGIGLLEAKQWDADFTRRFSEHRPYRNASHQIKHYLERTPGDLAWGVLTNGRKWRLYGTKNYETQTYYEVDLPELLAQGDLEAFKYFYVFFRPEAFRESRGTTFLDEVWSESETAAQELGEDLQDNVFTALRVLGRGFIESNDLDIDPDDDEALSELKNQSLVLLYRLMFVLYAESRGLIHPETRAAQEEYRENFSLDELRLEIHNEVGEVDTGFDEEFSEHSTALWSRLEDLFRLIDEGEESLGIPPYNGGLFDREEHRFLTENEVSNRYVAEVVYRLSTTRNSEGRYVLADYADLDTRHLGSVYEGLLEHQFRIASEQYAAVAEDGGQVWKPASEVTVADAVETVPEGGLYVVNDEGERKATGAYYTPDYVVTYIVEETVGPLVEEIREDLEDQGFEPGTQEYLGPFLRRVRDLKILDPAMGSAHFLTKATGYLAEEVISEVRDVEAEMGVAWDEQYVRRAIAKECIYGVDVNGMAVELAKLSMWLETLAEDRPLAFLDHHLKTGNSLVGSDIMEVLSNGGGGENGQLTLRESFREVRERTLEHVMELMQDLLAVDNESLEDVKSMEDIYDEIRADPLYQRLFELANVHTVKSFGVDVPEDAYEQMAGAIENEGDWAEIRRENWFVEAQELAEKKAFFHWELEYPAVFFDMEGEKMEEAGFDAVIGNPPYVRMEKFKQFKQYLQSRFETHASRTDLYVYFIEQSLRLLREEGEYGVIVSNKFLRANYGSAIRSLLSKEATVREIVDFGGLPVFPDATVRSAILLISNSELSGEPPIYAPVDSLSFSSLFTEVENSGFEINPEGLKGDKWRLVRREISDLMGKIEEASEPLIETIDEGEICRGIVTGRNEAFFIDDAKREELVRKNSQSEEVIKPMVRGENVRQYHIRKNDQYILYMHHGVDIDRYPAVEEHLREYKGELEGRATEQEWYELQQPQEEYIDYFDGSKILYPEIAPEARFALHSGPLYPNNKCFFLPSDNLPLVAFLNSTLCIFYLGQVLAKLEGSTDDDLYYEFRRQYMKELPVHPSLEKVNENTGHSLSDLAEEMTELNEERNSLNLSLLDYLGVSTDDGLPDSMQGEKLGDMYIPPAGLADSPLSKTKDKLVSLRLGSVEAERTDSKLVLYATARYKPENEDEHDTDRWGYTETELQPAMEFTGLSEKKESLIQEFVPVAVNEAGGFAGFRETATKTNSLIDRLKELTLPKVDDVEDGLESYIETKERAEELDEKIQKTDDLIDEIVYDLYGLTEEEIEIVEEAVK